MATVDRARQPFEEQIAFFRGKLGNLVPTRVWTDVWKAQHDRAFMVAGATKADLLADLAATVLASLAEGKSIEWFRENFDEIVAKHGWHYRGARNWRTRVIYQANMATSYAAGRLAQLRDPALQKLKPYWMYKHADGVLHPRPLHQSWHGLTLPADHPWFKSHYPPNGWGCHCRVVAVSAAEAKRQGGRFGEPPDDGIDPKTGEPNGIDKGWGYMPGDTVTGDLAQRLRQKAQSLPPSIGAALKKDVNALHKSTSPDDYIQAGAGRVDSLVERTRRADSDGDLAHYWRIMELLRTELAATRPIDTPVAVVGSGDGAKLVRQVSRWFPDEWTKFSDEAGMLRARMVATRGFHYTWEGENGQRVRLPVFGVVEMNRGDGFIATRESASTALHEFVHRLQSTVPGLDRLFQELHRRRTAGEKLHSLSELTGFDYGPIERARPDKYLDPYQGKEYGMGDAKEVMTIAFQFALADGPEMFWRMLNGDREMLNLVIGVLFEF